MLLSSSIPAIRLLPQRHKRAQSGYPWIYSNEIEMSSTTKAIPAGSIVHIITSENKAIGVGFFNPRTLIAARILSREPTTKIDRSFFHSRISKALSLRQILFPKPFYRLVHAEADGLPGLIIDRYDDTLVVQLNIAGMNQAWPLLQEALEELLKPKTIILKNDSSSRQLEGLSEEVKLAKGSFEEPLILEENNIKFITNPLEGQKTGWFYDHRDNRAFMARLSKGQEVLDIYTYAGGFSIPCAVAGATSVTGLDRSAVSLQWAQRAAQLNGISERCHFRQADAFDELAKLHEQKIQYNIVIADPPAFVKARKDLPAGSRAYRKLARLAAQATKSNGFLLMASCSYNMPLETFHEAIAAGLTDADRTGRILRISGAGPDHPVHPLLPETAYLKAIVLQID